MPDLLQFYGRALVEAAVELQQDKLTKQMINDVEESVANSIVGARFLEIERDPAVRLVMSSLLEGHKTSLSLKEVIEASNRKELQLTDNEVREVCDYLFIHGMLAYDGKTVRLANGFLKRQARKWRR
jgi:hypothetical protein